MKILAKVIYLLSFVFKYVIPIILFGGVIPLFQSEQTVTTGLTKAGYIAVALIGLIALKKLLKKVETKPKAIWRGVVLSIPCLVIWVIVAVGINWLISFLYSLCNYWYALPPFLIIGCLLYVVYEAIENAIHNKEEAE